MTLSCTLPFSFRRATEAYSGASVTTTHEMVHGLLRLHDHQLTIQWRLARKTERVGWGIQTDREVDPVQEVTVPVSCMAGAAVRGSGWSWLRRPHLVLTASDLTVLQPLTGSEGLRLDHPAELTVDLRRSDRLAAEEFCAELALAIASRDEHRVPPRGERAKRPNPEKGTEG
jgi:hypothetical protein